MEHPVFQVLRCIYCVTLYFKFWNVYFVSPCSGNGTQESIFESKDDEGSIGYAGKHFKQILFSNKLWINSNPLVVCHLNSSFDIQDVSKKPVLVAGASVSIYMMSQITCSGCWSLSFDIHDVPNNLYWFLEPQFRYTWCPK